jgi:hypothetical protein
MKREISNRKKEVKDNIRARMTLFRTAEFLLAEAMEKSTIIHNRMLDKQSPEITALEATFSKKPNLTHLKTWLG